MLSTTPNDPRTNTRRFPIRALTRLMTFALLAFAHAPSANAAEPHEFDWSWFFGDLDGDGLDFVQEITAGTDPFNPDTDGDGWFDGPTNKRYKLRVNKVHCIDEQDDWANDDFYIIVDDARWPQASTTVGSASIDGYWDFGEGDSTDPNLIVAQRVVGAKGFKPRQAVIEGWNDDLDWDDDWEEDDKMFSVPVDIGALTPGVPVPYYRSDGDFEYMIWVQVEIEKFADPLPTDYGIYDSDGDGISDEDEAFLSEVFVGLGDPLKQDIWVEVDWMWGQKWSQRAKRMVVSQFAYNGINLIIDDGAYGGGTEVPYKSPFSEQDWFDYYGKHFTSWRKGLFRYAIFTDELFNGRSGKAAGDKFLINESMFWIEDDNEGQAGTFMHELGHTLGLNDKMNPAIDTVADMNYRSCMNYLYQYFIVNYSHGTNGSGDFDDWYHVNPAYPLPPTGITMMTAVVVQ